MFSRIGQVMLYVNNQEEAVEFWTGKLGFTVVAEEKSDQGIRWVEIAPQHDAETSIILHDKDAVRQMSPGINLGTPSLMFFTEDLEELHRELSNKSITVGDIVPVPSGRAFNFADNEENYFAVMEKK